ncbi:hypothetical protein PRIPAC_82335 [Pristionchus pacificus]|uniref:Cytochrome P450 n=1 Tax=Pristionchus pacificus TaxID=54126 RepID=A0A2A6CKC1_PRIPA|nr:hypothetical protein PRIPAC_82335 [Pristionchus pacificus]|eukprot:PDM78550.1 cytochrome P450 [Pristionchus pacificus]
MLLLIICASIAAIFVYALLINKMKGLPPGPPPLPFFGNLLQTDQDMVKVLAGWKRRYGKVFTVWMPEPTVFIADHELLQEHIVRNGDKYGDRVAIPLLAGEGGEGLGLLFNSNAIWREQRRFALHTLRNIGFSSVAYQVGCPMFRRDVVNVATKELTIRYAHEIVARWKSEGANGKPIDLSYGIMVGVSNIVWQQLFGRTLPFDDPLFAQVRAHTRVMIDMVMDPLITFIPLIPQIRHLSRFFGSSVERSIAASKAFNELVKKELEIVKSNVNVDEEPTCYSEAFLEEMRKRSNAGEDLGTFSEKQLFAACGDLWIAGFETTVTTLRYAFHFMINNRGVQEKCQREIDERIGKRVIQMADQKDLHYCNAESLRFSSINMNTPRQVSEDVTIAGYEIPAGTGISPEFSLVHIDPELYERPDFFCPERHLNDQGELVKDPHFTPFSIGKRNCIGEGLARMQLFLFFTTFIQHLSFSSVSKIPPELKEIITLLRYPDKYEVVVESRD